MKDCLIVFDTSAYRNFVPKRSEEEAMSKISRLINLEKSNNIKALLATDVAVELYSHLGDLNDCEYNRCKNSVISQLMHCFEGEKVRYILNSDIHLCKIVFDKLPELSMNEQNKILKMSEYLYSNYSKEVLIIYAKNFNEVSNLSNKLKTEYIDKIKSIFGDYIKLYDKYEPPSMDEVILLKSNLRNFKEELLNDVSIYKLAKGLLKRAANTLNIDLENVTEIDKNEKIDNIRSHFLVPIFFFRNILKNIINSNGTYNFDNPKNGNDFWDYQLSFLIGNESNGKKIIFVTDDGKILTAAKDSGYSDSVIKLGDYLMKIGFSSSSSKVSD